MAVNDFLRRSYLALMDDVRDGYCNPYEVSTKAELEKEVLRLEDDIDALGDVNGDYTSALRAVDGNTLSVDQDFIDASEVYYKNLSLSDDHMAALSRLSLITEGDSNLLTHQRLDAVKSFIDYKDEVEAFTQARSGRDNSTIPNEEQKQEHDGLSHEDRIEVFMNSEGYRMAGAGLAVDADESALNTRTGMR